MVAHNSTLSSLSCVSSIADTTSPAWLTQGGFIPVLLGIVVMFWGITFVCEEYGVPSIMVFCKRNKIADDIAGSIFIGTGLSLPVLFVSFAGLFASNSAIGVGAVLGGNVFNQLITIGSSIVVSPNRTMKLDALVFTREMICYLISCLVLIWAVKSGHFFHGLVTSFRKKDWAECLSISLINSLVLVVGYFLYCSFEMYFIQIQTYVSQLYEGVKRLQSFYHANANLNATNANTNTNNNHHLHQPIPHSVSYPSSNDLEALSTELPTLNQHHHQNQNQRQRNHAHHYYDGHDYHDKSHATYLDDDKTHFSISDIHMEDDMIISPKQNETIAHVKSTSSIVSNLTDKKGDAVATLEAQCITSLLNDDILDFHDFPMYIRSDFYVRNSVGCVPSSRKWKLRYFTLDEFGMRYRTEITQPTKGPHIRFINVFDIESVEIIDMIDFEFSLTLKHRAENYILRTDDAAAFSAITTKLRMLKEYWELKPDDERLAMTQKSQYEASNGQDVNLVDPESEAVADTMFTIPTDSMSKLSFYILVFPMKYLVYLTVPDVRKKNSENKAILSFFAVVFWLAVQSYVLTVFLTWIGNWWKISSTIMGLTVAAWASNYPAHWSSLVVSKDGFGDVSTCNVLGSNVFNVYIGLGVPWLCYSFAYNGKPYNDLQDEGVVVSIIILIALIIVHYVVVAMSDWTLRMWMLPYMMVTYLAYIGFMCYFLMNMQP